MVPLINQAGILSIKDQEGMKQVNSMPIPAGAMTNAGISLLKQSGTSIRFQSRFTQFEPFEPSSRYPVKEAWLKEGICL